MMDRFKFIFKVRNAQFLNDGRDAEYGPQYFDESEVTVYADSIEDAKKKVTDITGVEESRGRDGDCWGEIDLHTIEESAKQTNNIEGA